MSEIIDLCDVVEAHCFAAREHVFPASVLFRMQKDFGGDCRDVARVDEWNASIADRGFDDAAAAHRFRNVAEPVLHERVRTEDGPLHRALSEYVFDVVMLARDPGLRVIGSAESREFHNVRDAERLGSPQNLNLQLGESRLIVRQEKKTGRACDRSLQRGPVA